MASHRRQRTRKARQEIQDPALQVAGPIGVTLVSAPSDRHRMSPDETAAHESNSIRAPRARVPSTPREVLSAVSDSEFEAEVDRFLDSLR
jgi:hypothetical protein